MNNQGGLLGLAQSQGLYGYSTASDQMSFARMAQDQYHNILIGRRGCGFAGSSLSTIEKMRMEINDYLKDWDK